MALLPLVVSLAAVASPNLQKATQKATAQDEIFPLLQKYCIGCHGPKDPSGGLSLTPYTTIGTIQKDATHWRMIVGRVKDRTMPPSNAPHPSADEYQKLVDGIGKILSDAAANEPATHPGHTVLHRLNRNEYNNTVFDLLGVSSRPGDQFPADGSGGEGFDNSADTLFIPPLLMERYLQATEQILKEANPERLFLVKPTAKITAREAARQTLAKQAFRAFRRPVDADEVGRLMGIYTAAIARKETHESALKFAMKGILLSPHFLFRIERETPGKQGPYPISDYALASRLSYFLWNSMPDEELFALATKNKLQDPAVLKAQVRRMILHPKGRAFAESFTSQWLRTKELSTTSQPDTGRFPEYTPALRNAMMQEPVEFFYSLFREDASLLNLLNADYTFLNEPLAKHYGIAGISGSNFQRVKLGENNADSKQRGGILTMAGVLTITSYPQRTSPVLRGKWVLEQVLGTPPPPPPPVVATLSADDRPKDGLTLRQRLEEHRKKPECASCHARLDPLGFGLENFDAIGRFRTNISGTPVDASGVLSTGEKFSGANALKTLLLVRKEDFCRNMTRKTLAYALGRGIEPQDQPTIYQINERVVAQNYKAMALIEEVALSFPFRYKINN